jgi:hypothetical protein
VSPEQIDSLLEQVSLLAQDVAATQAGADAAFVDERAAERGLLLRILEAVQPAFKWLANYHGPIDGLRGGCGEYHLVEIDTCVADGAPSAWMVGKHEDLGLLLALRSKNGGRPNLISPGGELPGARDGGPRLGRVLESLVEQLARHATGNMSRRRREAAGLCERLRAIQLLLGTK